MKKSQTISKSTRSATEKVRNTSVQEVPAVQTAAGKNATLTRGGMTMGSPGQALRYWNRWRENYNALVGLTFQRVRELNERTQRGDHAYPQFTYRIVERRHPVLKALIDCCETPIENFKWDVRIKKELPAGFTKDDATKQQEALKSAYAQVDNIGEAVSHLAHAFFRGYAHVQKHRNDGEVTHFECLFTYCVCRDGLFGDWFWNPDSKALTLPETVLGEANRIGGDSLPREDFIIFEVERPIDEIALENYVRRKLIEKDWSAFDEIFGLPSGVITMPPNVPPGRESEYEAAAKAVAEGGNGAIPNGSTYTANDQPRDGSNLFKNHISQLDEDLVLAGTGGKLTMLVQQGPGEKRGSAGTQQTVFEQIMAGRGNKVAAAFHKDFDVPFLNAKFPLQPALVEFCLVTEDVVDVASLCTNAVSLKQAGKNLDTAWLGEQTGYVFADDDAEPDPEDTNAGEEYPQNENPLMNRSRRRIRNSAIAQDGGAVVHEILLPLLKRLQAIAAVDDAVMQQHMIEKLLSDFPQISAAIQADDSFAKKLSPILADALTKGANTK